MNRKNVKDAYFEWLLELVCDGKYARRVQYRRLFQHFQETEFTYSIPMDSNRAEDGIELRSRFGSLNSYDDGMITAHFGYGHCSLLEMMAALAIRCEEHIMGDSDIGNRTGQWFWNMVINLELDQMTDSKFNEEHVNETLHRLLNREYGPNGEGGLFTVTRHTEDLREIDIWYQMCWHLDEML